MFMESTIPTVMLYMRRSRKTGTLSISQCYSSIKIRIPLKTFSTICSSVHCLMSEVFNARDGFIGGNRVLDASWIGLQEMGGGIETVLSLPQPRSN
ncbi:hypothetical protein TNCV_4279101 [Trichonephila clavipes]|nr:hypothetical protein TNCV_4279101 [Trichonephila clavipes]